MKLCCWEISQKLLCLSTRVSKKKGNKRDARQSEKWEKEREKEKKGRKVAKSEGS